MNAALLRSLDELARENGFGGSKAHQIACYTAHDIMKRLDYNFSRLKISPHGKKFSGELKRKTHWAVFNATGGDEMIMKFYTENIASFVELSVQKGFHVTDGGLPPPIPKGAGGSFSAVTVDRRNASGQVLKRKAKPFISHEIRIHGRRLFDRLIKDCGYIGSLHILKSVLPDGWTGKDDVVRMKTNGWESSINTFRFDSETY